jgi:hypothetical protein
MVSRSGYAAATSTDFQNLSLRVVGVAGRDLAGMSMALTFLERAGCLELVQTLRRQARLTEKCVRARARGLRWTNRTARPPPPLQWILSQPPHRALSRSTGCCIGHRLRLPGSF